MLIRNSTTTITLLAVGLLMVFAGEALAQSGVRTLPDCYEPGVGLQVSISANPGVGATSFVYTDEYPAGWTATNPNEGGSVVAAQNQVRWVFLAGDPKTLEYMVTPPAGASGNLSFNGRIVVAGSPTNTTGDTSFSKCVAPSCTVAVTPEARNVSSAGGNTSFAITASGPWTAQSSAAWATVNPMSGNGNGSVQVTYTANTGASQRSANITVSCNAGDSSDVGVVNQSPPSSTCTPVITLNGANPLTVQCGATFNDPGATESCDETVIAGTGNVNTSVVGTYTRTYTFSGATPVTRTVNVVDTTAPVITLNGSSTVTVNRGANCFTDPGATANDSCAGSVDVTVNGSVDCNTCGTYTLRYSATDASGRTATRNRVVVVGGPDCEGEGEPEGEGEGSDCSGLLQPTDLEALSIFGERGTVELSWNAPAVGDVVAYRVYRRSTGEASFSQIAEVSETTYLDTSAPSSGIADVSACGASFSGCGGCAPDFVFSEYYVTAVDECGEESAPSVSTSALPDKSRDAATVISGDGLVLLGLVGLLLLVTRRLRERHGAGAY